jgi:hypothetical protein
MVLMIVDLAVVGSLELLLQTFKSIADAAVPDIASHSDAHSAKQIGIDTEFRSQIVAVLLF